MKQLGNLALVCARQPDVLLQIRGGAVCLSIGTGPQRESIPLAWDDDVKITELVRELNFGRYQNTENGGNTHD